MRKTLVIWIVLVAVFLFAYSFGRTKPAAQLSTGERLAADLKREDVISLHPLEDGTIGVMTYGSSSLSYRVPTDSLRAVSEQIAEQEIPLVPMLNHGSWLSGYSGYLILIVVFVLIWAFLVKRASTAPTWMSLRKTLARPAPSTASFSDVGGCEEGQRVLADLIDYLRDPGSWQAAGVRMPRGVLLEGPPGCGKTLLGRALAGEAKANFLYVAGSEFVELFVGVGAARIRDTFEQAKKKVPAIIFIDEFDALGRTRTAGIISGHEEREQAINQLLVSMDGFTPHDRVVVLAATNRADLLDQAVLRPGRFDRIIHLGSPDQGGRREILAIHAKNKVLAPDVDLERLAEETDGFTGAQLEAMMNEAGMLALRRRGSETKVVLSNEDFTRAHETLLNRTRDVDELDTVMIASNFQMSYPTKETPVRVTLEGGSQVRGVLNWANVSLLKLTRITDGEPTLIPKTQIQKIELLRDPADARE